MQDAMQPVQQATLSTAGWVTMVVSLVLVWGGTFWCFNKVLETPAEEKAPPGYGA